MNTRPLHAVPGLRAGVRLVHDPARGRSALLHPEGVLLLNDTAAAVLRHCDGRRDERAVTAALTEEYDGVDGAQVDALLADLAERRLLALDGTGAPVHVASAAAPPDGTVRAPAPLGLIAELTYRCPLQCTYCANPVELSRYRAELDTGQWLRVLDQARELGVLQLHLTGGEPLLRRDLTRLIAHARTLGLYTNLITSGVPLADGRADELAGAGLDHVQLSVQDTDPRRADAVTGTAAHDRKLAAARHFTAAGLPLTVNAVLHRGNLARLGALADRAVALGADRVELAHVQYYGWAWRNRAHLAPTEEQVRQAERDVAAARERHAGRIEIVYVSADLHGGTVKPCMNGWGREQLAVAPNGDVLPCLAAAQLPGLTAPNAVTDGLAASWHDSPAFNRFRGTDWMPEPCRSCALRELDHGGCRCQAHQLTGDPAATDPACRLSPHHHLVTAPVPAGTAAPEPRRLR
ncbi:pyrroloquinoline quinone biosynthesis protein PqqE [Streptomyces sp. SP17BM10]|uniref:pyrroloquinoline quinone biosynthesis protein PqqE n=1 Tax=Streptomyces sp. SP17BM10 TaxID=3002530 RepID=UPI002E779F2D|nr:pyrroloquinoline quinone biosynthesis protein PqqE [Streptomyces sp. SP17BM10]MEE1788234.1 pyrroloquinoline quinone biosynthesis protein PqqE [Streptomyces sp. SP17BM10]